MQASYVLGGDLNLDPHRICVTGLENHQPTTKIPTKSWNEKEQEEMRVLIYEGQPTDGFKQELAGFCAKGTLAKKGVLRWHRRIFFGG
jgi:hypothetical protein